MPIESGMLTQSLDQAQKKAETTTTSASSSSTTTPCSTRSEKLYWSAAAR